MSRLSLTTNIASMNAQRNFTRASKDLETSFSRLSSGMRINRVSDDAAGLSVSSLLNADRAVLAQGIRNLNDGISYLNIAEGGITELTNIMFRIQEIAEQSANGTLSNDQRKPLQDEVTALQNEYNRIIHSTRFNDMKLLTGVNTLVNLQGGYGIAGGLAVQIGSALVSDAYGDLTAGETIRVSTASNGSQGNGNSNWGEISADGNFIVFYSQSSNLISGVSGTQVYRKNLVNGALELISSNSSGVQGNGISDTLASISADNRYVVFASTSDNLVTGVSGSQIYIKDTLTGDLSLVSSNANGISGNGTSRTSEISANGRFVVFSSDSDNLIAGVTGMQAYVKDLVTGDIRLASSNADGVFANHIESPFKELTISSDGRYVTFRANTNEGLLPGVSGHHIYRKDMETGTLQVVSTSADGTLANGVNNYGHVSDDGRYLVFTSTANNLQTGVSGTQIYRKDMETGEVVLVSSDSEGNPGSGGVTIRPQISANGRYVVFRSTHTNYVDGVSTQQFYRKDIETGELLLVSRSTDGSTNGIFSGEGAFMSADGSRIVFSSNQALVGDDTNGVVDIYMRIIKNPGVQEMEGMVVSNQASAGVTLTLSKQRLEALNLARAGIGASSSRIGTAISNLSTMTQNFASAASQITDTDVAEESAKLAASQILQQAGAAVLSQANLQPQLVLRLLKNI